MSVESLRRSALATLAEQARFTSQITGQALTLPMWNFDEFQVREQLNALRGSKNFCGARVKGFDGEVFVSVDFPEKIAANQFVNSLSIVFDNPNTAVPDLQTIGTFELCISKAGLQQTLARAAQQELLFFALIMLAVMTAGYFSMLIVLTPLRGIRGAMEKVARTMAPISDPSLLKNNEIGALVRSFNNMVVDLTQTYRELDEAREVAVRADKAKSEFLANMSHELRTPLNSIIGLVQILSMNEMSDENHEMIALVKKSSETLLNTVSDILDISKIEAGEVHLEHTIFDAYQKIRNITQTLLPLASRKGLALSFTVDEERLFVYGDPLRFERILNNLVSNAIRYTDKGIIKIKAHSERLTSNSVRLYCQVVDTGIGIPEDRQEKIFEKFTQADTSTTRRYGGTGLGLTITKELVELMGGAIGVQSEEGRGSTFWFEIPMETAEEINLPDEEEVGGYESSKTDHEMPEGHDETEDLPVRLSAYSEYPVPINEVRILLAEDHEVSRAFMKKLFQNLGVLHYTMVENGKDAVKEVQKRNYDIVLMDCHMPEMNGYDATTEIRSLPDEFQSAIPIVAMTANAMANDEERCLAIGMNGYISKPFKIETFKERLAPWIAFRTGSMQNPVKTGVRHDHHDLINLETLVACSMGDEEYVRKMVSSFVTLAETQVSELEKNRTNGKSSAWVETAHSLKGTAGVVGAERLQDLCSDAQMMEYASAQERDNRYQAISEEFEKIRRYLEEQNYISNPQKISAGPDLSRFENQKILVVDDHALMRNMVSQSLRSLGVVRIEEAPGAEQAWNLLTSAASMGEPFHIIFLDLHMPEMNGTQLLEKIRQDNRFEKTAVIILSAEHEQESILDTLRKGAIAFIAKPVSLQVLETNLKDAVRWRRR